MERHYYTINETAARQAQAMWSFSDYKQGSKTQEYRGLVDVAYDLTDQVAEAKPDRADEAYSLADRYAKRLAENFNKESQIDLRCPSVMIAGGSNFPVRKKEKQIQAMDRNHQDYTEIQKLVEKIRSILFGREIIKCGDGNAIGKLEEKLASLEREQEKMKAVNAYYRKHNTLDGCPELSVEEAEAKKAEMQRDFHFQDKPYLSWQLSNNNQNIRSTRERLERLRKDKEQERSEYDTGHFKVVENTDIMRLQLFFDGKPDQQVRSLVKESGFRWSPSNGCWQRQLTDNARYSLKCLVGKLDEITS